MVPRDPIAAVTHPDPYPYYADLAAKRPLYRDETLGMWVASGAVAVTAILASDACAVRPPAEPVPAALLGSPAADIFRHLVRMNDGPAHCPFKQAIAATLGAIDHMGAAEQSRAWARILWAGAGTGDVERLSDFAFQMPVHVVGRLLGIPRDQLKQTAAWIGDFTRCLAPRCNLEQLARGKTAAAGLLDLCRTLMREQGAMQGEGLLAILAREATRVGRGDPDVIIANGIGFLSQAYEATAGLIGNTLVALARFREVRDQAAADPGLVRQIVLEVLRRDPSVQNTRRFLVRDGKVAGEGMKEGESVLVVVAAANLDPAVNPDPLRFDILRRDRRVFTFGHAAHACPGESLAMIIAEAGVARVIASGTDLESLVGHIVYRDSLNVRIPILE